MSFLPLTYQRACWLKILHQSILKAKQVLSKAIDELVNDRIGIIVYAGKAYAQLPLTTDYTAAKMFLEQLILIWFQPKEQIGNAVEMALSYFESGKEQNRVLFIRRWRKS